MLSGLRLSLNRIWAETASVWGTLGHGPWAFFLRQTVKAAGMPCGLFWQWQEVEGCFHWRML